MENIPIIDDDRHRAAQTSTTGKLRPTAGDDGEVRQMTARGFRNILQVVILVFIFALIQMLGLQRVCDEGMRVAQSLEHQGLPNLSHLALLREHLILFRLYSYEFMFAQAQDRPRLGLAADGAEQATKADLTEIKQLLHDPQGQQLTTTLETTFNDLAREFDRVQDLVEKDFAGAMSALDHTIPPKIQKVDEAAEQLNNFGYQFSGVQAKATFNSFDRIKDGAIIFGIANIAVTLGLVVFVHRAARKTRSQLAKALDHIQEQALELRLQASALEAAASSIAISQRNGNILWVNRAFTHLTGYPAEEVVGQNPRLLKSGRHASGFYADMWATINAGKVWHGELVNRRKDGGCYDEEMTITPVVGADGAIQHFIAIKQDVSERKKNEQLLARERDLLQALMDNLPDYIYFKDTDSRFIRINLALARYFGLQQPAEAIGKSDADFFGLREARQKLVDERCLLATGKPILGLVEKGGIHGEVEWVSSTKVPIYGEDGKITGLVGISRDITEHKQAEESLLKSEQHYRGLFEHMSEGFAYCQMIFEAGRPKDFVYLAVNDMFTTMTGLKAVTGRRVSEVIPGLRESDPDLLEMYGRVAKSGKSERCERFVQALQMWFEFSVYSTEQDFFVVIFDVITERKQMEASLRESEEKFRQLAANVTDMFWMTSPDLQRVHYVSPAYERIWGRSTESLYADPRQRADAIVPEERERVLATFARLLGNEPEVSAEYRIVRPDGTIRWVHDRGFQVHDAAGNLVRHTGIASDITERKRLEVQLSQSQKLESIGQLAAGIAHEINTPIQYVGDNTRFVKDSFGAIVKVLHCHEELLAAAGKNAVTPELLARNEEVLTASDLDYLYVQIPSALAETLEGVERVSKIVRAMKDFSHPGSQDKSLADLNRAIESTVTVARNEWKYVADMKLELEPDLPLVPCFVGEFNQAILNLVVNAAHAIGDVVKKNPGTKGCITIRTHRDGDHVEVRVADTGTGIAEAHRQKIFDPFFTTKDVGKGTGQGLSIVYGCIVKHHGGTVTFETEVGQGTTFIIRLSINPQPAPGLKSVRPLEIQTA
jgi:PAS domain S-box-containing protein